MILNSGSDSWTEICILSKLMANIYLLKRSRLVSDMALDCIFLCSIMTDTLKGTLPAQILGLILKVVVPWLAMGPFI